MGPAAGVHGGEIVAQGTPQQIMDNPSSVTGQYLTGAREIEVPEQRRPISKKKVLKRIKRGRTHVYQPSVTREQMSRAVIRDLQDVLFSDRLPSLMLGLLEDGKFSLDDVKALKAAIRKVEKQG